jgi:hypothetical protein
LTEDHFFTQTLPLIQPFVERFREADLGRKFSNISDREARSVYFYTTENPQFSFLAINPYLVNCLPGSNRDIEFQVKSIDSCLMKLPPYVGTVLRGEEVGGWMHSKVNALLNSSLTKMKPTSVAAIEQTVSEFFMSSTLSTTGSYSTKPVIFVILSRSGGREIIAFSALPDEKEILFKRKTTFLIVSIDDSIENRLIVTLTEAPT